MDRDARIDEMLDKQDISEYITRFTRGIDRHDVELARSAFHEDGRDDHAMFVGSGYDLIDWANEVHKLIYRNHLHYISNMTIDIDGDVAHAETYSMLVAGDKDGPGHAMGGGRYLDRLERRDGRWGIVDRYLIIEWHEHFDQVAELVFPSGQDRSDPSYTRPLRVTRENFQKFAPKRLAGQED